MCQWKIVCLYVMKEKQVLAVVASFASLVVVVRVFHSAAKVSAVWVFSLEAGTNVLAFAPGACGWWVSAKRSSNITEEQEKHISLRKKTGRMWPNGETECEGLVHERMRCETILDVFHWRA